MSESIVLNIDVEILLYSIFLGNLSCIVLQVITVHEPNRCLRLFIVGEEFVVFVFVHRIQVVMDILSVIASGRYDAAVFGKIHHTIIFYFSAEHVIDIDIHQVHIKVNPRIEERVFSCPHVSCHVLEKFKDIVVTGPSFFLDTRCPRIIILYITETYTFCSFHQRFLCVSLVGETDIFGIYVRYIESSSYVIFI